jgi:hypothetical protein
MCVCVCTERCLRCVPHDEDTGGFFVATLRKIEKPTATAAATATASSTEVAMDVEGQANAEKVRARGFMSLMVVCLRLVCICYSLLRLLYY